MSYSVFLVGLGRVGMGYDLGLSGDAVLTHARAFSPHPAFRLVGAADCVAGRRGCSPVLSRSGEDLSYFGRHRAGRGGDRDADGKPCGSAGVCARRRGRKPCSAKSRLPIGARRARWWMPHEKDCTLFVNYLRRSAPGTRGQAAPAHGLIEEPLKAVAWYSKGLIHSGSHLVNLLQFWLGPIGFSVISGATSAPKTVNRISGWTSRAEVHCWRREKKIFRCTRST